MFFPLSVGAIGFAVPSYTFSEDDGVGIVTVEGPTNFPSTLSVNIVGGELITFLNLPLWC